MISVKKNYNKTIYLAGGCFWGVQEYYSQLHGVISSIAGYANGNKEKPTYEEVKSGEFHFVETVKVIYDIRYITLEKILEHFLRFVDPYSINKQGEDEGVQYRSGVYFSNTKDKAIIKQYFDTKLNEDYKIEIKRLKNFYQAEEYHQDYLKKNPNGYCHINLFLIKPFEKKTISFQQIAVLCADVYEDMPENEFTDLEILVDKVTNRRPGITIDDLYEILPYFMQEVATRGIPLVMYKVPGPFNEPVFQFFRKIAKQSGFRYPSSSINFSKPKTAEELIEESEKNK